jgi:outer membrane lipoprotein-sorting protein
MMKSASWQLLCAGAALALSVAAASGQTPEAEPDAAPALAAPPAAAKPAPKPAATRRIPLPPPRPASLASAEAAPGAETKVAAAGPITLPSARAQAQPAAADTSPRAIVERANASLNAMNSLSAEFVQVGQNGRRLEGNLFVQKPGKMRFEYKSNPVEIVADGSSVAIRDRKLNTQDVYSIGQTPLKFLLKEHVDLARDTKLVSADASPDLVSVSLEDKSTFGGTSRVTLFFDPRSYALKQWLVVDPQGYETNVSLRNVDLQAKLDQRLFNINFTRILN